MEPILKTIQIGKCTLPNRVVFAAASLCRSEKGTVTPEILDFYAARAKGGVGLLIAGGAAVDPSYTSDTELQIHSDDFLLGLSQLTQRVHQEQRKIFLQLLHPGAYATEGNQPPMAPSEYCSGLTRRTTKAMSQPDIAKCIQQFAQGASRAQAAGFDGIELCGSVGYLIAEFLSSSTNHRTDEYGGSLENRARFLQEIIAACKAQTGSDFPVIVRLSGADFIPNGNSPQNTARIAALAVQAGADAISITGGWHESRVPQITGQVPHGAYAYLARTVKEQVSVPVILSNRMDLRSGRQAILDGDCDCIALCRPLIADPNLVQKLKTKQEHLIRTCLSCNQECLDRVFLNQPVSCTINPQIGQECIFQPNQTKGKRIFVIGAGISGMTYAALAAETNQVTILEKAYTYGGAGRQLASFSSWSDTKFYLDGLYASCLQKQVTFRFGFSVSPEFLQNQNTAEAFDEIVIAAGSVLAPPEFPVASEANLWTMDAFLQAGMPLAQHTVILGNDYRALEFAIACAEKNQDTTAFDTFSSLWIPSNVRPLSAKKERTVTCLGPGKKPGGGMARSTRWVALQEAKLRNLSCLCDATVLEVTPHQVRFQQGDSKIEIPADTVILAQKWIPNPIVSALAQIPALQQKLKIIGDCSRPGRITQAVQSAWTAAKY